MSQWITFSNANLPIQLNYPNPTPQGFPVRIHEYKGETSYRAHLVSDGSDEVYFEVGRYQNLSVKQAIDVFLKDVRGRFDSLKAGEVEESSFATFPAYRFSIRWPGKERIITFIEKEDALFRIIYDPTSLINRDILDSVEFLYSNGEKNLS